MNTIVGEYLVMKRAQLCINMISIWYNLNVKQWDTGPGTWQYPNTWITLLPLVNLNKYSQGV